MKNYSLIIIISTTATFVVSALCLFKPLWYDEALTVLEFLLLNSTTEIYHHYAIPNNHIFYSIILKYWLTMISNITSISLIVKMRILTLIFSSVVVSILAVLSIRKFEKFTAIAISATYLLSSPFTIYCCSIRGYMLSTVVAMTGLLAILN